MSRVPPIKGQQASVVVVGGGPDGQTTTTTLEEYSSEPKAPARNLQMAPVMPLISAIDTNVPFDPEAMFLLVDIGASDSLSSAIELTTPAECTNCVVTTIPRNETERRSIEQLREIVDAVVLIPAVTSEDSNTVFLETIDELFSLIFDGGFVNLDLADFRTIIENNPIITIGVGVSPSDHERIPGTVQSIVDEMGAVIDLETVSGVLVGFTAGSRVVLEGITQACQTIHDRVGSAPHLIWGMGVREKLGERVRIAILVAGEGLADEPLQSQSAAGDPCPRCGTALVAYTLGRRHSIACDRCGFADIDVKFRR